LALRGLTASTASARPFEETASLAETAINEQGAITAWNREAERTFGWARQVAVGSLLRDLIIPLRYRASHDQGLRRFREIGSGPLIDKRIEITALHRNGHEFPVELTIRRAATAPAGVSTPSSTTSPIATARTSFRPGWRRSSSTRQTRSSPERGTAA